jgi:hypothetical protein
MPYLFLTESDHLQLDSDLDHLLKAMTAPATVNHPALLSQVRAVITSMEGKLLRPAREDNPCPIWKDNWIKTKTVTTAWFENISNERESQTLHTVFKELVRYHEDATSPYRKEAFAADLAKALKDYLSLRGNPLPPTSGLMAGKPAARDKKKTGEPGRPQCGKRGRKQDTDPKADERVWDAWKSGEHKDYEALGRELDMSKHEVQCAIDRHRHRLKPHRSDT